MATAPQNGKTIYVNPRDVLRRILYRNGHPMGVTFRSLPAEVRHDAAIVENSGPTDTFVRGLPQKNADDFELAVATSQGATAVPWADDYRNGGSGPVYLLSHGLHDWFVSTVRGGSTIWDGQFSMLADDFQGNLGGAATWDLLRDIKSFRDRLLGGASVAGIICLVAAGRWSDSFMTALWSSGFTNEAHFARDQAFAKARGGRVYVGVLDNKGYDTYQSSPYGNTRGTAPGTRYPTQAAWDDEQERLRRRFGP